MCGICVTSNLIVRQPVFRGEVGHRLAVVTTYAVSGAEPDVCIAIFEDPHHVVVAQALFFRELLERLPVISRRAAGDGAEPQCADRASSSEKMRVFARPTSSEKFANCLSFAPTSLGRCCRVARRCWKDRARLWPCRHGRAGRCNRPREGSFRGRSLRACLLGMSRAYGDLRWGRARAVPQDRPTLLNLRCCRARRLSGSLFVFFFSISSLSSLRRTEGSVADRTHPLPVRWSAGENVRSWLPPTAAICNRRRDSERPFRVLTAIDIPHHDAKCPAASLQIPLARPGLDRRAG